MGSSTSKSIDPEAAVTPVGRWSYSRNVFQTSCMRPASGSSDSSDIDDDEDIDNQQVTNHRPKENVIEGNRSSTSTSKSKGKTDRNKNIKRKSTDKRERIPSSETHVGEWGESSLTASSSSSRFLSRFTFFPGNTSSRSSRAYPESSTSSIISNDENDLHSNHRTKTRVGCDPFPSCFMPRSHVPPHHDSDSDTDNNSDISSIHELHRDPNNNGSLFSPRNGHNNRRMEPREPVEQTVRFSRTLSVGRLRDRVVHNHRPIPSFPFQAEREEVVSEVLETSRHTSSTISNSLFGNQDFEVDDNIASRETRYSNLLEHRSNFLERRRRIRSQVHALQRMGNRFENLSGHERSCILSGEYQSGHCSCRVNNQDQNDGNSTRGSISRIVLLAEALFEVLDEIHQQSVVSSSSRPALSSIGSVPAPIEAVEALPVKIHQKLPKNFNEDDAQCYICLVEYEDGDEVRVLPCHHEFHRLCIDKWLKEIHRICPLCRGDICKTGSLTSETLQL
ncbi:hypothetical protein LXL04_029260 [Taraxacum kok-saghyz]